MSHWRIAEDLRRLTANCAGRWSKLTAPLLSPPFWAVAAHRLAHALWKLKLPLLPRMLMIAARILTAIEIDPSAHIGPGLLIIHGAGLVIGHDVRIGRDATLLQGTTLGWAFAEGRQEGVPTIGNNVSIYAGAKVLGPVTLGDGCRVGANAVVTTSFGPRTTLVGAPARAVEHHESPRMEPAPAGMAR